MTLDMFSLREGEIFRTLRGLKGREFAVIGGYAVNAYALPRFSVDCDIVVRGRDELKGIGDVLAGLGYRKKEHPAGIRGPASFSRYEKTLGDGLAVSMDILAGAVVDRMSGAAFPAEWVFGNSSLRMLRGKTLAEELMVRIIDLDALLVMKILSCRQTDIRDVFMMMPHATDTAWIRSEIARRHDLRDRMKRIIDTVSSRQFRDGLAGVYGSIDKKVFEKHRKALLSFSGAEAGS